MPEPKPCTGHIVVGVRIDVTERALRHTVKAAGGKWRPATQVWELPYGQAVALGLLDRVVADEKQEDTR
jgi:hypothetical protein